MKTTLMISILFFLITRILALSGYGTSTPVINDTADPLVVILSPNGGEEWYMGDTNDITWNVVDTNISPNGIYLWYSLDGGTSYTLIADALANSGIYPWDIPASQSFNAKVLIKAYDSFGNSNQISSAHSFSISFVPPKPPDGVSISTPNGIDALISWQPVTETIYNTPITPDGYIVLYNESPYEHDEHFYYYLWDVTTGTSFTHGGVMRRRGEMFYRIVAYKDYDGRMIEILDRAKANASREVSFQEIQDGLKGVEK